MILCWAVDFEGIGGEGSLARSYAIKISSFFNEKAIVVTPQKIYLIKKNRILSMSRKKQRNNISMQESKYLFAQRFIYPFTGFFLLYSLKKKYKKRIYLNYLPLWLFPIFVFAKLGNFRLGPIVGGIFHWNKNRSIAANFFRIYLMGFCYRISIIIIKFMNIDVLASSKSLNDYLRRHKIEPSAYSLNLNVSRQLFDKEIIFRNKEFDFVFYYRDHPSKYPNSTKSCVSDLEKKGFKVLTFGERYINNNIQQIGYVDREVLLRLFSRSKIFINIADNPENLTVFDSISQGCEVINITPFNYKDEYGIHYCEDLSIMSDFAALTLQNLQYDKDRLIGIRSLIKKQQVIIDNQINSYLQYLF